ncbi:MAG: ComF family protein [Candidatus Cryptobacteroides sp.]
MTLRYILQCLADLLFPRQCTRCSRELFPSEKHLCLNCLAELPLTYYWKRERNPMADHFNAIIEQQMPPDDNNSGREAYAYSAALFHYDTEGSFRDVLHRLKYKNDREIGRYLGTMLAREIRSAEHFRDIDVIVPVPLHWTKLIKRGYNQAAVIAEKMAQVMGVPADGKLLVRKKKTKTQTLLDTEAKKKNVNGAFAMRDGPHKNYRHILLVDDVFTTGATAGECFRALRTVYDRDVRISVATLAFTGQ